MVRQSSNTVTYSYGDEVSFDADDGATPPVSTVAALTGWAGALSDDIAAQNELLASDEETGTFVAEEQHLVGVKTAGSIPIEFRADAHDWAMEKVLNNAGISTIINNDGSATTVTPGANTLTLSASNWATVLPGIARGMWIYLEESSWKANNQGYFRVEQSTFTGTTLTIAGLTTLDSETPLAVSALDALVGLPQIVNGTDKQTFVLMRDHGDQAGSDRYNCLLGQLITGMSLSYDSAKSLLNGSFTVMGARELPTTSNAPKTPSGASTAGTYGTNNVLGFMQSSGTGAPTPILSWSLNIQKNDFTFDEITSLRPVDVGLGGMTISGTVTTYHPSQGTMYSRALSETGSNTTLLALIIENANAGYVFDVPGVKFSNARRGRGPKDSGLVVTYDWVAHYHRPSLTGLRICKRSI